MPAFSRRQLLKILGLGAASMMSKEVSVWARDEHEAVQSKPIEGSWISILWDDRRHFYWNDACAKFTAEQWNFAVKEMTDNRDAASEEVKQR